MLVHDLRFLHLSMDALEGKKRPVSVLTSISPQQMVPWSHSPVNGQSQRKSQVGE